MKDFNKYKKYYGIIYLFLNKSNGKCYVGQSTNFYTRYRVYKGGHCQDQPKIYNAFKKYGFENFDVKIIAKAENQQQLDELEDFYIDAFDCINNGYNCKKGGANGKHSEETKIKISNSIKGSRNWNYGKGGSKHQRFGAKHSEESKVMMSQTKKQSGCAKGVKNSNYGKGKAIICNETGEIFSNAHQAGAILNVHFSAIHKNLKGKSKYVGKIIGKKLTFRYLK